jgi:hypothetical protein
MAPVSYRGRRERRMQRTIESNSVADAAIIAFRVILETMSEKQRITAAKYAEAFVRAGVVQGEDTKRLVEGIFGLFDDNGRPHIGPRAQVER